MGDIGFGIWALIMQLIPLLIFITVLYLGIKLYRRVMYYLELKTRYLEQKMGIDSE